MKELGRPRSLRRIIAHSLYSSLREKERALKTTSQDERLLTRPVARLSTPRRAKPVRAKAPQMMIRGGADCHGMLNKQRLHAGRREGKLSIKQKLS